MRTGWRPPYCVVGALSLLFSALLAAACRGSGPARTPRLQSPARRHQRRRNGHGQSAEWRATGRSEPFNRRLGANLATMAGRLPGWLKAGIHAGRTIAEDSFAARRHVSRRLAGYCSGRRDNPFEPVTPGSWVRCSRCRVGSTASATARPSTSSCDRPSPFVLEALDVQLRSLGPNPVGTGPFQSRQDQRAPTELRGQRPLLSRPILWSTELL